jgi:hypothetical protein
MARAEALLTADALIVPAADCRRRRLDRRSDGGSNDEKRSKACGS